MSTLIKQKLFAGKFEIQGEIAKGQTGTILYGYDLGLRQEVAIKVYHSHINGRAIRGKAFVDKSQPLLRVDHPNLLKIFKVEEVEDTPVVFMEFFDAPNLQHIIRNNGPLPVEDMLLLARGITEVLVHTHLQGIIHGTLHPGHVLVGPQGQIKVLDLGLSWILMDSLSNCDDELLRPLPYFPPEIAKGELLTISSDLYCLGFMMYEMLSGTVPYAGLPKTSIMGKLAFDQADPTFDFPDAVPEPICNLIREMTRNKAQQRLQDATHVLTIINQHLSKFPSAEESTLLPPDAPQSPAPATPASTDSEEPKKVSTSNATPIQPSTSAEPEVKQPPKIQRPQKSPDYSQINKSQTSRNIGIIIGLILLLTIAGTVGYWYRDLLESHLPSFSTEPNVTIQETNRPVTQPTQKKISLPPVPGSVPREGSLSTSNALTQKEQTAPTPQKEQEPLTGQASPSPKSILSTDKSKFSQTPQSEASNHETSLVTPQKQPKPTLPTTPVKAKPLDIHPTSSEVAPKPTAKSPIRQTPKKFVNQPPTGSQAKPTPNPVPALKEPTTKQSIPSEKQSSETMPMTPENAPLSKTQIPKEKPVSAPPQKNIVKDENQSKSPSLPSAGSSVKNTGNPVEKENEKPLKTLDEPTSDFSSIAIP